jgi:hypothetical protein
MRRLANPKRAFNQQSYRIVSDAFSTAHYEPSIDSEKQLKPHPLDYHATTSSTINRHASLPNADSMRTTDSSRWWTDSGTGSPNHPCRWLAGGMSGRPGRLHRPARRDRVRGTNGAVRGPAGGSNGRSHRAWRHHRLGFSVGTRGMIDRIGVLNRRRRYALARVGSSRDHVEGKASLVKPVTRNVS